MFKPILDAFEKKEKKVLYLTSAKDDPVFKEQYKFISAEYIGTGNRAFARLNFLEADICLMTTPGIEVFQIKRSKGVKHYSHILHDTGDATCYRLFGIDWFDSILLSGTYQISDIRKLEKIRSTKHKELEVVGSTYLDIYNEKIRKVPVEKNHIFTVLISPSWGPGSLLNIFGEKLINPLLDTGWKIIIRPHPQSKKNEGEMLLRLEEKYKNSKNIIWDYNPENIISLARADVMFSDFSGIIFDYIFLFNKPVIYSNAYFNIKMYDAADLDHIPKKFEMIKLFGTELKKDDLENIVDIIKNASENEKLTAARKTAKETAWQYIGESGERSVDFLVLTKERIKASC
ncbi:CDP-glycerol glycerophosphotransferase family protein [Treponema primitia]|uniref:CDP-glycerol glycerophosphotransferase family protein n=1 Tax=Treponema primitia TaxID=88058 RepID=UPI002FCD55A9